MMSWRNWAKLPLGLAVCLLAACSSTNTFTTQVSVFEKWPASAHGKSYVFSKNVNRDLESQTMAQTIAQSMQSTGLVPAASLKSAHYVVDFSLNTQEQERLVQEVTQEPFMFMPMIGFGNFGWNSGWYGGMNMTYSPRVSTYPVRFNRYTLNLTITDKRGQQLYQATARADSARASVIQVLPYMAAAIFDDFPSANGQVKTITYDVDKSTQTQAPTKVQPK